MLFVVVVVVLHTDPWLCLGTGLGFFWGPEGPPLMGKGETVSWIQKVHVVTSSGARPPPNPTFTATFAENLAVSYLEPVDAEETSNQGALLVCPCLLL